MIRAVFALALIAAAPVFAAPAAPAKAPPVKEAWDRSKPRVTDAWVRVNPVPGRPSAGYLTITGGGQPDKLTAASAPGVRIEMHSMSMAGGVMKMAKLEGVPVPAAATVNFASGGNHLMIFGLAGAPKSLPITLQFASGAKVTVDAPLKAAGAEPAKAMDHSAHHD